MPARLVRLSAIGLTSVILMGCGGSSNPVTPVGSAVQASAAPTSATPGSPPPLGSPATATPAAALDGRIVFEDSGQDFKFSQIWIENADSSDLRQLVKDEFTDLAPAFSPDGGHVVFSRVLTFSIEEAAADTDLIGQLLIVDVDGTDLRIVPTGAAAKRCGDEMAGDGWSPDGLRLVVERFCFDRATQFVGGGLRTMALDGSAQVELTHFGPSDRFEDHRAGWSPDGSRLVFERIDTSVSPERAALFTIGADGSDLFQVTPWALGGNDPDWSPDGQLIAFNAPAEPAADQNIYVIRPDGTGLQQVTTFDGTGQATFHPSWSPDGSLLLFSHSPATDGWGDLFVIAPDGTGQRVIASTPIHENHAFWGRSPGG